MQDYNVPRWGIFFFFSPACGKILHFVPRRRKYSFFSPPLAGVQGVDQFINVTTKATIIFNLQMMVWEKVEKPSSERRNVFRIL